MKTKAISTEAELRLECLRVAQACFDPEISIDLHEVMRLAAELMRFVQNGELPPTIALKLVGK